MNGTEMLMMLYVWVLLLTVLIYYLVRRILKGRHRVLVGPTYPIVRALSIMLIAFTIRQGFLDIIIPFAAQLAGLEYQQTQAQNSFETIVFYLGVTLIALAYAWMVRKEI